MSGLGLLPFLDGGNCLTRKDWKGWWEKRRQIPFRIPILIFMCGRDKFFTDRTGLYGQIHMSKDRMGDCAWEVLNIFREMSGRAPLERDEIDFDKYPFRGIPLEKERVLRTPDVCFLEGRLPEKAGEVPQHFVWAPGMEHCLYYGYASLVWEFFRRFQIEPEIGEVV